MVKLVERYGGVQAQDSAHNMAFEGEKLDGIISIDIRVFNGGELTGRRFIKYHIK